MMDAGSVRPTPDVIDVPGEGFITIYQRKEYMAESDGKTLAQQYYEEVEALKAAGTPNAEAIRQVAANHGKKENAVRGGLHQYRSKLSGGDSGSPRRSRTAAVSVDQLVASASQSLQDALGLIDYEIELARTKLDEAKSNYDLVVATSKDKKADIERKLKALA